MSFLEKQQNLKRQFYEKKTLRWFSPDMGWLCSKYSILCDYFEINNAASSLLSEDFSCPHVTGFLFSSLSFSLRFARMSLCHFTKVIITLFFNILSPGRTILVLRGPYNHWSLGNEFIYFFHDEKKNFLFL